MQKLRGLNDRIVSSITHEPLNKLLHPVSVFSKNIGDLLSLGERLSRLDYRAESTLNVVDFDDTLYSRYEQLQLKGFQDNRGEMGNKFVRENFGFRKFIEKFYSRSRAVEKILGVVESQTETHTSLILTAGMQDLQELKVDSLDICRESVALITVDFALKKPLELIKYIIDTLKYVPGKIIIYEDKPECFEGEMQSIRQLLPKTEIVVDKVFLNPPGMMKQIHSIEQNIYKV
ncbi:hypothetical protein GW846_03405 [Candidatus Gracilibacteria bacterium]|nr:hypothetical protein [Candidatus Gracilibacteria bacterium]